jgi:hypothetical protein
MYSKPRFIQGVFTFEGSGLATPARLGAAATYDVPADKRAQVIYMRAGSTADDLICLTLVRDGKPMRYFPIGAKQALHVPLAVTEDVVPESRLEVQVSAAKGVSGTVVIDVGLLEVD